MGTTPLHPVYVCNAFFLSEFWLSRKCYLFYLKFKSITFFIQSLAPSISTDLIQHNLDHLTVWGSIITKLGG